MNLIKAFKIVSIFLLIGTTTKIFCNNCGNNKVLLSCSGNADVVGGSTTGVGNASNTLGTPDGNFAELYDEVDILFLDLSDTLDIGETYTIIWRRKATYSFGPSADLVIEESYDNVNWTTNPFQPSTDQQNFISTNVTTVSSTRYLRIRIATASDDDVDLDAISYDASCSGCIIPSVTAFASGVTCFNGNSNDDGYLVLASVGTGDQYNWSVGSTYSGNTTYDDADPIGTLPFIFKTGIDNPTGSRDYTIRVFSGESDCFTDVVVTLYQADCVLACGNPLLGLDQTTCTSTTAGCLGGLSYDDINCNGVQNTAELGVGGVEVKVYDCDNTLVGTAITDTDGDWQICGLIDNEDYRVEFVLPTFLDCLYNPTHNGAENGTDIQFVTAPACTKFSLSKPGDYCEEEAFLITPCYVNNDNTGADDVVVRWSYDNTGTATADKTTMTLASQAGAMWGMGYDKINKMLYGGAVLKRHAGLYEGINGGGIDAIYQIDPFSTTPNAVVWLDFVDDLGISTGTVLSNAARGLATIPNNDEDAFAKTGKVGFGDIEVSEDGTILYAMNLFDRKVYAIDIATKTLLNSYAIPDPGCTNGTYRPWALAVRNGKVYAGSICDGSSVAPSPPIVANKTARPFLEAFVYRLDGSAFNEIMNFPLDYQREAPLGYSSGTCTVVVDGWYGWVDEIPVPCESDDDPLENIAYPQPMLTDIEFDDNGNMILGFTDRSGFQLGAENYGPTGTDILYNVFSGGDVLFACNNGSDSWTIENAVNCMNSNGEALGTSNNTYSTGGWPNIGEYFVGDFFADAGNLIGPSHFPGHGEISFGALAYKPNSSEVVVTAFDPVTAAGGLFSKGGVIKLSTLSGRRTVQGFQLYDSSADDDNTFGKGVGLGDLELLCAPAPLEIGNYVWCDSLQNGIQDACERGLDDIIVQLYDRNGVLVGQDTTVNGQYYFNQHNVDTTGITVDGLGNASPSPSSWSGMSNSTQYFIVFGDGQFNADQFTVSSDTYGITTLANAGSNDKIDSDVDGTLLTTGSLGARPNGLPFIDMTTAVTGCGEHKYDMGLTCTPVYSLGNQVFLDADNSGALNGTEVGIDGVQLQLLNSDGTVYDADPNTAGVQALTVTTANGGYYRFDGLKAGEYIVEVVASNFITGNSLATYTSSTGVSQEADPDSDGDSNDNGLDTPIGGAIRSAVVTLGTPEPTTEIEPSSYAPSSIIGTAAPDDFSNLTVDFGFYGSCSLTATVANMLKCTSNAETMSVSLTGGSTPDLYNWSGPFLDNPGSVASFSASVPGIYTVTVTDDVGCTATASGELTFQSKICLPVTFKIRRGKRN